MDEISFVYNKFDEKMFCVQSSVEKVLWTMFRGQGYEVHLNILAFRKGFVAFVTSGKREKNECGGIKIFKSKRFNFRIKLDTWELG